MELKIFRDTLPQGGAGCTVKAELPLETEIRISDDLPPVGKLVKCFVRPVVLQRQLQPGRLTLEGYLRCTVFYQSEAEKGLCQTEQKLPFTRQLELPELAFTAWTAVVEGQTEYLNTRAADPRRIEVRGAYGLVVTVHTQCKTEVITALADGGIEQQLPHTGLLWIQFSLRMPNSLHRMPHSAFGLRMTTTCISTPPFAHVYPIIASDRQKCSGKRFNLRWSPPPQARPAVC